MTTPENILLAVRNLRLSIGAQQQPMPVLRGVDLDVSVHEVHALVGESGAGKSMIGKAILGILPAQARVTAGAICFDHQDITHLNDHQRRALMGVGLALIPQDPMTALNPGFRIGTQLMEGMRLHLRLSRAAARTRALELLESVHIRAPERVLRLYPHELSGGMRQRVLIAIAFSCRPKLIIADEPTTALDVTVQRQVLRLIHELQAQEGTAILFITHDLGVVAKICDRMTVLHAGRVVEQGTVADVYAKPAHPYTRALFGATPRYDRPGDALTPVPEALNTQLWQEAFDDDQRAGNHA